MNRNTRIFDRHCFFLCHDGNFKLLAVFDTVFVFCQCSSKRRLSQSRTVEIRYDDFYAFIEYECKSYVCVNEYLRILRQNIAVLEIDSVDHIGSDVG